MPKALDVVAHLTSGLMEVKAENEARRSMKRYNSVILFSLSHPPITAFLPEIGRQAT